MLTLTRKKFEKDALAGVCRAGDTMAVAKVRRKADLPPVLEFCDCQEISQGSPGKSALLKLLKKAGIERTHCVSLMDMDTYQLHMLEAPDVEEDELASALRWRVKDLIDFRVEDAVIDVFQLPESRGGSGKSMVYAVVARADEVKKRIDYLLGAGVALEIIDIPELAMRNVATLLPEDVGGVALVYIGNQDGLITITRQGTLYLSRRLSSGLQTLPATLMQSDEPEILERWLDGIAIEIQRSLDYYGSHFSLPPIASLVIAPLAREIPGMAEYIGTQLDIATRLLDANELIDAEFEIAAEKQSSCLMAIGAALREEVVV